MTMTDTPSDVLLKLGAGMSGAQNGNQISIIAPENPAVVCSKCDTVYQGKDIHLAKCVKCSASLLAKGTYLGGACPYCRDSKIPYGKCHCGCGADTKTYTYTHYNEGAVAGAKGRFLPTHGQRSLPQGVKMFNVDFGSRRKPANRSSIMPRGSVLGPVRDILMANPGVSYTTQKLARLSRVTPKQASTAFSTLKANDPSFVSDNGTYTYMPQTPGHGLPAVQASQTWPHQRDGMMSHRSRFPGVLAPGEMATLSEAARQLYRAFEQVADLNGRISMSAQNALKALGMKQARMYASHQALTELHNVGCVDATNNRVKYLIQHPNGTPFVPQDPEHPLPLSIGKRHMAAAPPSRAADERPLSAAYSALVNAMESTPAVVVPDALDTISDEQLGTALARLMWERYEWALSEVGRLHEVVAQQRDQIDRLEAIVAEQPVNVSSIARRFLADQKN